MIYFNMEKNTTMIKNSEKLPKSGVIHYVMKNTEMS